LKDQNGDPERGEGSEYEPIKKIFSKEIEAPPR
jgi:hypothetical protein